MHMHNRTSCISILYLNFLRSYLTFNFLSFFLCRCLFFSFIIACAPESTTQSLPQPTSSVACLNCNSRSNPSSHYVFCFSALIYSWHVWRSTKFHVVRTLKNAHVLNTMREIEIVQFSRGWNCFWRVFRWCKTGAPFTRRTLSLFLSCFLSRLVCDFLSTHYFSCVLET